VSLSKKQRHFTVMVGQLIIYAGSIGCELTFGDAFATSGHKDNSFHYKRLAVDFNLFIDDVYQTSTEAHKMLGEYWELIGGTWGGRFKNPDGNHYSYGE
jgi:hypothetical protein